MSGVESSDSVNRKNATWGQAFMLLKMTATLPSEGKPVSIIIDCILFSSSTHNIPPFNITSLLHYATIFTSIMRPSLHHNYSKLILFILRMLWSRNIYRFCVA